MQRIKQIIYASLLTALTCLFGVKSAKAQSTALNGTWIPLKMEIGGKALPEAAFEKQRLILQDSAYTVTAESTDKGTVKFNGNKIDIFGKDGVNAGKHFTAIYKYENNELTVCYDLSGNSYSDIFDTRNKPTYFLSVYKKE